MKIQLALYTGQHDNNGTPVDTLLSWADENDVTEYEFSGGGENEEGYCYSNHRIRICPEDRTLLEWDIVTESKDCDGRMTFYKNMVASIESIGREQPLRAYWTSENESQRDYSAEAMNY